MPGEKGRVIADVAELNRWKKLVLHDHSWSSNTVYLKGYALFTTVLLLAMIAHGLTVYLSDQRNSSPAGFRLEWQSLVVFDHNGKELWRKSFPETIESASYSDAALALHRKIAFVDIDGDGEPETLFVYSPVNSLRNPSALYCFSRSGMERWSFAPARANPANTQGSRPTHVITDMLVTRPDDGSEAQVLLLDCELPGHLAKLFVLSPRGETMATYAHDGHLGMLESGDVDNCGVREILMGGSASERQEAELIVVEVPCEKPGRSGARPGSARLAARLGIKEKVIMAFSRTCVNRKLEESNRIARIVKTGEVLTVGVSELIEDPAVEVTYQLDRRLRIQAVWFSDTLRNLHRSLETQGVLDHQLTTEEVESFKEVARLEPHTAAPGGLR
jgi:hypothetical protein